MSERTKALIAQLVETWNSHDPALVAQRYSDDCHILDDCSEKALLFIDVIDENRLIKLRRTHCGKYLEMD